MGLNANEVVGKNGPKAPTLAAGSYPARLAQVIDLGLQAQRPYQGKEKPPAQEIMLTYELVDEFLKDEDGNDQPDKPRHQSESMALHNLKADKAKSTARYFSLDPSGKYQGDFAACLATPVLVTIVQNPGKGKNAGQVFANVQAIAPMRDKDALRCPQLVKAGLVFDLDKPDLVAFQAFPRFIQDKIRANLNYEGSVLKKLLEASGVVAEAAASAPPKQEVPASENPY